MCNVEIAEVYVVENAPYCKLNYNMARFLFYLLSFLYYLRGYFYCFLFSHTHSSLFFVAFFAWLWVFFLSSALHTHSSLFFSFLLGCGYFSCLLFSHTHSSLFFIAFLLGCGYFSCLMLSIPMTVYFL